MEKERNRAAEHGYPSPIQPDKESSDHDYDDSVRFCIENIDRVATIVATIMSRAICWRPRLLHEKGLPHNHKHVHFSQLYGMSDNITFNLAKTGF